MTETEKKELFEKKFLKGIEGIYEGLVESGYEEVHFWLEVVPVLNGKILEKENYYRGWSVDL